ncbi:hypothetical protein CLOM_g15953 [Closterium sp. NIES-68]|nr:hypothetical protein CLOM_g23725 [Closterium sp. NIES-68]GJP56896.1 hypothetical protein CLOM_g15953 [Closterium sp. NIES-68]GJP66443.1 hypothetical protein CLOP_g23376 [Closterium sp. NIES-67]GJP79451.1 hypothetical protein CLOP_g9686 [Closterium sp. NIES-67]
MSSGLSVSLRVCCDVMVPALASLFDLELTSLRLTSHGGIQQCPHTRGHASHGGAAADASGQSISSSSSGDEQLFDELVFPAQLTVAEFHIAHVQPETQQYFWPIFMDPSLTFFFPAMPTPAYSRLLSLHLEKCKNTTLPPSLVSSLTRLTALSFSSCFALQTLASLHMDWCSAIVSVPPEALCLPALRSLRLTNCRRLESAGLAGGSSEGCCSPLSLQEGVFSGCGDLRYVNWRLLLWRTLLHSSEVMLQVNLKGCRLRGIEHGMHMLEKTSATVTLPDGGTWNSTAARPSKSQDKKNDETSLGVIRCLVK